MTESSPTPLLLANAVAAIPPELQAKFLRDLTMGLMLAGTRDPAAEIERLLRSYAEAASVDCHSDENARHQGLGRGR